MRRRGGGGHTLALKEDGTVWAWGLNFNGQLGDGNSGVSADTSTPGKVLNLAGVRAIDAHDSHTLALKQGGTVWAWGWNFDGQLGDGTTTDRNTPVQVQNLGDVTVISTGLSHSLAKVLKPPVVVER